MSTVETTSQWMERIGDYLNPILVKETRQSLKSRQFVATFMLMMLASWVISIFGVLSIGQNIHYTAVAQQFFFAYYVVLAIAIFVVIPFSTYRSMLAERDQNTLELLSITTLAPSSIIWGKLFSALVQVFIFYSAITPFVAFTVLLEGFDLAKVAFLLVISLVISISLAMFTLMISTLSKNRMWQALSSVALVGGLIWALSLIFMMVMATLSSAIPIDDPDFWLGMGITVTIAASYFWLFKQIATAQLTFESDNRSTGIRITCSVQLFLVWGMMIIGKLLAGGGFGRYDEELYILLTFSTLHCTAIGLFAATEDPYLSRRTRRDIPESRIRRLLLIPYLPGRRRGLLYLILHVGATWLMFLSVLLIFSGSSTTTLRSLLHPSTFGRGNWQAEAFCLCTMICCYQIIFLGLGSWLGDWLQRISPELRPAHLRVVVILLFAFCATLPVLPYFFLDHYSPVHDFGMLQLISPIVTMSVVGSSAFNYGYYGMVLVVVTGIVIVLNLSNLRRGIKEIMSVSGPVNVPTHHPDHQPQPLEMPDELPLTAASELVEMELAGEISPSDEPEDAS